MMLITKTGGERPVTEIMTKLKEVLFMYTSEPKQWLPLHKMGLLRPAANQFLKPFLVRQKP